VRVFWPRDDSVRVANDCTNGAQATVGDVTTGLKTGMYHVVLQAGAIRQPW
jgi:hypothetical protein